jgi:filamentous hemagglutinin family protein
MFLRYKMTIFNKFNIVIMLLLSSLASPTSLAQITLDGTLGRIGALTGPDYQITADLGQQHGGNLFHSFNQFDIHPGESATFSGPNNVNHIISRVTGGNPSHINGILRSQIPDADLYLLNPAGIFFGQGVKLDVPGSFHASTADTLRFEDGSEFNARQPQQSLLTVAQPRAFGFLTDTPAQLTVEGSTLVVQEGRALSLIGGGLNMNNAQLEAAFGRINLASLASSGEVIPTESDLQLSADAPRGSITANNTSLDVSGEGGGSVFIRGGRFELTDSVIADQTLDNKNGEIIDIQVARLKLQGSIIDGNTTNLGKASSMRFKVDESLELSGMSGIYNDSIGTEPHAGNAGSIEIEAGQLTLTKGGQIGSGSFGSGEGGSILIKVTDALNISGSFLKENMIFPSGIYTMSTKATEANAGKAGKMEVEARQLTLTEGGQISSDTEGPGEGNSIFIKVADVLTVSGQTSSISSGSRSMDANAGNAGDIKIQAYTLNLTDSGIIATRASSGGNIIMTTPQLLYLQRGSIFTNVIGGKGKGGNITIYKAHFTVLDDSEIIAQADEGNGGNITIQTDKYIKSTNSVVGASSRLGIDGSIRFLNLNWGNERRVVSLTLQDRCAIQLRDERRISHFVRRSCVGIQSDELSGGVLGSYLDISTKR